VVVHVVEGLLIRACFSDDLLTRAETGRAADVGVLGRGVGGVIVSSVRLLGAIGMGS
jgi:hypothetical protein